MSDLYVADSAESELPVLLCLHSLFLDHTMFDGLAAAAAGRFRVVRPDFRGQGRSPDADATVTMDQCADDIASLIDEYGLQRVSIVAQSMGGDVAVRVAALRPDDVDALVFLGSSVCAEPQENLDAFRPIADLVADSGFGDDILPTVMGIMFGQTCLNDPARSDTVAQWRHFIKELPPTLAHAIRGVIERPDASDLLPAVRAKTWVVNGTEDVARPPAWGQQIADGIEGARMTVLPEVGHSVILEQPRFADEVLEFLS